MKKVYGIKNYECENFSFASNPSQCLIIAIPSAFNDKTIRGGVKGCNSPRPEINFRA
jgi:hypothetical protein